ncbi:MAG: hypothetical protein C0614_11500 [Desulfuromonas sp.]|nr:MAG: hypothetical protein C0614_11500 [Desulfuromonas sp.]
MNIRELFGCTLIAGLLVTLAGTCAWADRDRDREHDRDRLAPPGKELILDRRHHHNHYYPRPGHIVPSLPKRVHRIKHHRTPYFFADGIWYRSSGLRFSVILPPAGVVVPVLPRAYTTVWVGTVPYYYAGGVYYTWSPRDFGYVVTDSPVEGSAEQQQELVEPLFVYPKLGQDEEQQALDRYECHLWAVNQTGFDPTRPGGNVPREQNINRRLDYNRATESCLEGRGYSVR